jgi:hypothetical protein
LAEFALERVRSGLWGTGDAAATAVAIGGGGIGMAQRKAVAVAIPVFSTIAPTLSTAMHAVLPTPRFTSFVARRIPNFLPARPSPNTAVSLW